jgi:nicotinamide mononucleotide (NMN) deamidase PncC
MSVEGKFLSKEINDLFWREGLTLVTAESCTAGSVAAAITAVSADVQANPAILFYIVEFLSKQVHIKSSFGSSLRV